MPSRFEFERAVKASSLPPLSRLLALTIATFANSDTGIIPARYQPSLSTLMAATGMSKGSLLAHRKTLDEEKWVTFTSPSPEEQRRKKARNSYKLHVPAGSAPDLATGSPNDPDETDTGSAPDPELGQQMNQVGSAADHKSPLTSLASKPDSPQIDGPRIAANCQPLVTAMQQAGIHVSWELTASEWLLIEAILKRVPVDVLVGDAVEAWHRARTTPRLARYFIPGWRGIPAIPEGAPRQPLKPTRHLRPVAGQSPEDRGIF
ncbi:hypothetical protein SAMN06272781_6844 [Streptomyces sp. 1222.2]|uniref:hypothetical protein n=1 Tax=Streptomyces sp. 1222.2 TaxID=1938833 RepID=UPI000BD88CD5|nr:hypothetical protein [Streptomyces sp. 1222.2]SOD80053.1 hypothetical protein SAMN06272781_6844 [Streptomyces sp. 1222.2]